MRRPPRSTPGRTLFPYTTLFRSDGGIAPTIWQANSFPKPFRSKIKVVHDGIDTDVLRPNPDIFMTINDKIKITRDDEIITFVNRNLEPVRGFHVFMRALPEILRQRPNARVLIVGGTESGYSEKPADGSTWRERLTNEVRPQISDEDWNRVHFLGRLPYQHFISLLQISSVHVYLTYPFVLSWSLLEAMSIGCTIVASDTTPLHEAIKPGKTGVLVDFFDPQGFAREICALLADPEKRARLGKNARAFARSHYDLRRVCLPAQMEWVYSLLGKKMPAGLKEKLLHMDLSSPLQPPVLPEAKTESASADVSAKEG